LSFAFFIIYSVGKTWHSYYTLAGDLNRAESYFKICKIVKLANSEVVDVIEAVSYPQIE
jgi:hypothetical protein